MDLGISYRAFLPQQHSTISGWVGNGGIFVLEVIEGALATSTKFIVLGDGSDIVDLLRLKLLLPLLDILVVASDALIGMREGGGDKDEQKKVRFHSIMV